MARCSTCGNDYEGGFEVKRDGKILEFDCLECAVHMLAPLCESCGCRILGHGVQSGIRMFCSAHCARQKGVAGLQTHL